MTALRRVVLTCDVVQTVLEERAVQLASRALDLVVSRAGAQTEMLSTTLSLQFSLPSRQTELLASLCGGRCAGDTATLSGLTLPDTALPGVTEVCAILAFDLEVASDGAAEAVVVGTAVVTHVVFTVADTERVTVQARVLTAAVRQPAVWDTALLVRAESLACPALETLVVAALPTVAVVLGAAVARHQDVLHTRAEGVAGGGRDGGGTAA